LKHLKFSNDQINGIISGEFNKTWRLFDDKDLYVGDIVNFINSDTNESFGQSEITKVTIKRLGDISDDDKNGHKPYASFGDIVKDFNKYYSKEVSADTIVKVVEYKLIQKKGSKIVAQNTTNVGEVKIFTDGGSRGNPGISACAYVITDMQDNVVKNDGLYLGITTNNQAEYLAVKAALQAVVEFGAKNLHFYLDSLLVVNQLNGVFKIRNRELWPINQEIKELIKGFDRVSFVHIPRELNKLADQRVNIILDQSIKDGLTPNLV